MWFMEDLGMLVHDLFSTWVFINIDIYVTIYEVFHIMWMCMDYTLA